MADFVLQIQELRRQRKITQLELAQTVGIGRTYLSEIEGGRSNPSLSTLSRIAAALEVPLAKLFVEGKEQ